MFGTDTVNGILLGAGFRWIAIAAATGAIATLAAGSNTINTFAGTGTAGYSGDGGAATIAKIDEPKGLAVTDAGDVFFVDGQNAVVREVDAVTGDISTVAGGVAIPLGDGSAATSGWLLRPHSIAADDDGNIYIADTVHHRIRKVDAITGNISTFAGTGEKGYSGDGGAAASAKFNRPEAIWVGHKNLLFVVANPASLTLQEGERRGLMQSWGHRVALIDDDATQAAFDAAVAIAGVAYVSEEASSASLGTKLKNVTIGVVLEEGASYDEYGFSSTVTFASEKTVNILDNTHYITSVFSTGTLTILASNQSVPMLGGTLAAGLSALAETHETGANFDESLTVLDTGASLYGGGTAAGRRVSLPWGGGTFDVRELTTDGKTIMRRSIEWAMTTEPLIYIADTGNHCVRKIDDTGNIATIAGTGVPGFSGDGGAATSARLDTPAGIGSDFDGVLYVSDTRNHRIRTFSETGNISTYAGTGTAGGSGDGGAAGSAQVDSPHGAWVAGLYLGGDAYPSPATDLLFVVVNPASLTTQESARKTLFEGWGYTVTLIDESDTQANFDTQFATNAVVYVSEEVVGANLGTKLNATCIGVVNEDKDVCDTLGFEASSLSVYSDTLLDITDNTHYITSVFATGQRAITSSSQDLVYAGNNYPAAGVQVLGNTKKNTTNWRDGLAIFDPGATLDGGGTAAGRRVQLPWGGDNFDVNALNTDGQTIMQRAVDWAAMDSGACDTPGTLTMTLFIADTGNHRVRKADLTTDVISAVAGTGTAGFAGDGGAATSAQLDTPTGVAVNSAGDVFICDKNNERIRKVTFSTGNISTYAGTGTAGYAGDGGAATSAQLNRPWGVAVDENDDVFIADAMNHAARKVTDGTGVISLLAGTGGDHGITTSVAATSSSLGRPGDVDLDGTEHRYIACPELGWVRKVDQGTGVITTIMGTGDEEEPAVATDDVLLRCPSTVAVDDSGNVYVADEGRNQVVKLKVSDSTFSVVAGTGARGFAGDGSAATSALLDGPKGVAVDETGNIYIADTGNERIRKVDVGTGDISTIAGTGAAGYTGDGGAATSATLNGPARVEVDRGFKVYVVDQGNHAIRRVGTNGTITTLAGTGAAGFSGDGGDPTLAKLDTPSGIGFPRTVWGVLYLSDTLNHRVRDTDIGTNGATITTWAEVEP